ncbi:MAG: hypothetical protein LQ346_003777 [Caloplaca aetnensis]|nr:MAG: hypothetical protein LQ346_003777 [Caloplaca aetnensis]
MSAIGRSLASASLSRFPSSARSYSSSSSTTGTPARQTTTVDSPRHRNSSGFKTLNLETDSFGRFTRTERTEERRATEVIEGSKKAKDGPVDGEKAVGEGTKEASKTASSEEDQGPLEEEAPGVQAVS